MAARRWFQCKGPVVGKNLTLEKQKAKDGRAGAEQARGYIRLQGQRPEGLAVARVQGPPSKVQCSSALRLALASAH